MNNVKAIDVLNADILFGNDTIPAPEKAPVVTKLVGAEDNDSLAGTNGIDKIYGKDGNDTIRGRNGDDTIYGDNGNDKLVGGHGNDLLVGGRGTDYLYGGDGDDTLEGGAGNDRLNGGRGDDLLLGGNGHDIFTFNFADARGGFDVAHGGFGNDRFNATNASGDFFGEQGNDIFTITSDLQTGDHRATSLYLHGGEGADTFSFTFYYGGDTWGNNNVTITDFNPFEDKFSIREENKIDGSWNNGKGIIDHVNFGTTGDAASTTLIIVSGDVVSRITLVGVNEHIWNEMNAVGV